MLNDFLRNHQPLLLDGFLFSASGKLRKSLPFLFRSNPHDPWGWCLAILSMLLCCDGVAPWMVGSVRSKEYEELGTHYSPALHQLVARMLIVEPSQRVDLSIVLRPEQQKADPRWWQLATGFFFSSKSAQNPKQEFEQKRDHEHGLNGWIFLFHVSHVSSCLHSGLQPLSATFLARARFTKNGVLDSHVPTTLVPVEPSTLVRESRESRSGWSTFEHLRCLWTSFLRWSVAGASGAAFRGLEAWRLESASTSPELWEMDRGNIHFSTITCNQETGRNDTARLVLCSCGW